MIWYTGCGSKIWNKLIFFIIQALFYIKFQPNITRQRIYDLLNAETKPVFLICFFGWLVGWLPDMLVGL